MYHPRVVQYRSLCVCLLSGPSQCTRRVLVPVLRPDAINTESRTGETRRPTTDFLPHNPGPNGTSPSVSPYPEGPLRLEPSSPTRKTTDVRKGTIRRGPRPLGSGVDGKRPSSLPGCRPPSGLRVYLTRVWVRVPNPLPLPVVLGHPSPGSRYQGSKRPTNCAPKQVGLRQGTE